MARTFEDKPAVREKVPVLVALAGASGSGKTFSALRLATGIQRVFGGDIFYLDTEAKRALHYAELFKFRHVEFGAPFSPLDYLEAIQHCVAKGAKTIVVDSMSHEHEGPGGVLEWHARLSEDLAKRWKTTVAAVNLTAWNEPKSARRRLINTMIGLPVNFILCFRAKQKLKIEKGKDPVNLGWMPIAGEEYVYEMTLKVLLYPGSSGHPTWSPSEAGEKMMVKVPEQFREIFSKGPQLTEDVGEQLAKWAAGGAAKQPAKTGRTVADIVREFDVCDLGGFGQLQDEATVIWEKCNERQQALLTTARDKASARLSADVTP